MHETTELVYHIIEEHGPMGSRELADRTWRAGLDEHQGLAALSELEDRGLIELHPEDREACWRITEEDEG